MAKAETRPEAEETANVAPNLGAHDAPGLSPLERMTELTRRIVNVPKAEVDRKAKRDKAKKKRGH